MNETTESLLTALIPCLFVIVFPLFWSAVVLLIAVVGGWRTLAERYPVDNLFGEPVRHWAWQSMRMSFSNYNGVLTVDAYDEGLRFSVMFLFRPGHRPFLVPWEEISVARKQMLWQRYVEMRFARADHITIYLTQRLANQIEEAMGPRWRTLDDGSKGGA